MSWKTKMFKSLLGYCANFFLMVVVRYLLEEKSDDSILLILIIRIMDALINYGKISDTLNEIHAVIYSEFCWAELNLWTLIFLVYKILLNMVDFCNIIAEVFLIFFLIFVVFIFIPSTSTTLNFSYNIIN